MARRAAEVNCQVGGVARRAAEVNVWAVLIPPASRLSEHLCVLLFQMIFLYIPSEELVADLLTKAVTGAKFKYLRVKLLG